MPPILKGMATDVPYMADYDYSYDELASILREGLARSCKTGEEYYVGSRRVRFPGISAAMQAIQFCEQRSESAANANGPTFTLASFGRMR